MSLRGFDVSHWQGAIDWPALKAAHGITFGAAKATEGVSFRDSEFPANWAKMGELATGVGFVRMAYHYGHPNADPDQSAGIFLDYVHDLGPTDLLVLDLETGDGLTQAQVNTWAKTWAAALRALAPSHRPVLYCGHAYMENATGVGLNGPFSAWWYPRYPFKYQGQSIWPETFNPTLPSPNAWGGPPDFWQFAGGDVKLKQPFLTAQGYLDADVFDGTLAELRAVNT